ncbi:hypothetical protein EV175_004930 [Coemansia sp. RSA 1933]|nr:hypothetical protein EV175_004930 [Coemansia sp. RSA 1933]
MNYLAAATSTPKKPSGNKSGALASSSAAAAAPQKHSADAVKMKANSPANRLSPVANTTGTGGNGEIKKPGTGSSAAQPQQQQQKQQQPAPLSYAAKAAAAKRPPPPAAAAAQSATSAGITATSGENGKAESEVRRPGASSRSSSTPAEPLPLASLIDTRIRVKLVDNSAIEGVLFAYDVYSGVVALVAPSSGADFQVVTGVAPSTGGSGARQQAQVDLIKAANIVDVEVISKKKDDEFSRLEFPAIQKVPPSMIEARKQKSLSQAQERAARIGVGVSNKAQSLFDALSRTLPCQWSQGKIVVLDEISIEPPYNVDNCRDLTGGGSSSLQRVKKVLQGELSRLERSATGSPSSVATK